MNTRIPRGIFREIRRSRLLPVLAFYVTASAVIIQLTDIFVDRLGLPDWFFPGALVLLVVGLPVVIATALAQAGQQDGVARSNRRTEKRRQSRASHTGRATRSTRSWLTWRRALLSGALGFTGWGLIAAGYMLMRTLGIGPVGSLVAAGVIDMREPVLVADFQNRTSDPYLGDAVTEAFRVDLARSEVVTLVEPDRVRSALERMGRPTDAVLGAELTREVAMREGINAIVTGDITSAGSGYVLSARLVASEGGEILRAARTVADSDGAVIAAIDQLSRQLRERIGESLVDIRHGEPLERVTTASLDALHRYSRGIRVLNVEGDVDRGTRLLQEAVALDSTFAMAHRRLGMALRARDPEAADTALSRAYRHRERLTEEEAYLTVAAYYSYPGGDSQRAMHAYEAVLEANPDHGVALNNLALLYGTAREAEKAIALLRRAVDRNPRGSRTPYGNLIGRLIQDREIEEAAQVLERMQENFPPTIDDRQTAGLVAFAQGNFAEADQHWRAVGDSARDDPTIRRAALNNLAVSAATRGRLSEAEPLLRQATEASEDPDLRRLVDGLSFAWMRLLVGQPDEALRLADALLDEHPLVPDDHGLALVALALYAMTGHVDEARRVIARFDAISETPFEQGTETQWVDAFMTIADGRPDEENISVLREITDTCPNCTALMSWAFDQTAKPDSAVAYARRFVEPGPDMTNTQLFVPWLGEAIWRVAEAEEAGGAADRAAAYYGRLADLWADADADLQPRVAEARRRIAALRGDGPTD